MSDQVVQQLYELTVKDGATPAMQRVAEEGRKLYDQLVAGAKRQQAADEAAQRAAAQAASAEQALATKRNLALLSVLATKARLADAARAEASAETALAAIRARAQQDLARSAEQSAASAAQSLGRTAPQVATVAEKIKGLGLAAGLAGQSLEAAGVSGASAASVLAARLGTLAAVGGPVAVALAAVAVTTWGIKTAFDVATESSRRLEERLKSLTTLPDGVQAAQDLERRIDLEARSRVTGVPTEVLALQDQVAIARANVTNARRELANLTGSMLAEQLVAVNKADAEVTRAERALTAAVEDESRKRAEATKKEMKERAEAWRAGYEQLASAAHRAARVADMAGRDFGSILDNRLAALAGEEEEAVQDVTLHGPGVTPEERARQEAAVRDRFDALREQARAEAAQRRAESGRALRGQATREALAGEDLQSQLAVLEAEHRQAVDAALRRNEDVAAVDDLFRTRAQRLRDDDAKKAAKTDEERKESIEETTRDLVRSSEDAAFALQAIRERARVDSADQVQMLALGTAEQVREENLRFARALEDRRSDVNHTAEQIEALTKEHQARLAAIEEDGADRLGQMRRDSTRELTHSTEDALRALEDLHRTTSEQALAAEQERYARQLADLEQSNGDKEAAAREHAARMELIRARSSTVSGRRQEIDERSRMVLDDPNATFGQGAGAAVARLGSQLKTAAELGASATDALASAFVRLGDNATSGSMKASEAIRSFARDAIDALRQIAVQQAALKLFTLIFPATAPATAAASAATASGATAVGSPFMGGRIPVGARAAGGVVTSPEVSLIGEAGPEAVIPLRSGRVPVELRGRSGGGAAVHIHHHHSWNVQAIDARSMAAVLLEQQEVVASMTAESLNRDSRVRSAVRDATR